MTSSTSTPPPGAPPPDAAPPDAVPPAHRPPRLSAGAGVTVAVLLLVPLVGLGAVPLYSRTSPAWLGFPFFYWYQLIWVLITPVLTWTAYLVIKRGRGE